MEPKKMQLTGNQGVPLRKIKTTKRKEGKRIEEHV
jgi:hypothetical protein